MTLEELRVTRKTKGFTKAQLAEWGVSWPPIKGWKRRLLRAEREKQIEARKHELCTKCGKNEAYWSASWCEDCIWQFVQE